MRLALLTAALVLASASIASAATVSVVPDGDFAQLRYLAGPGEANALTVTYPTLSDTATVSDPGAPVTPGSGCVAVDVHTATCAAGGGGAVFDATHVALGDGDDSVASKGSTLPRLIADGGAGDDTLAAPSNSNAGGSSELDGGPGADHLLAVDGSALL